MDNRRYIALIFLIGIFLIINLTLIKRMLIGADNLKAVNGTVINQYSYHRGGKSPSDFIIISVAGEPMQFGVQDTKERAFKYLSTHRVINKTISILYDQNGHNQQDNVTFHVYGVTIDAAQLLTIKEAKQPDETGLMILDGGAILIALLIFIGRRIKNKKLAVKG